MTARPRGLCCARDRQRPASGRIQAHTVREDR